MKKLDVIFNFYFREQRLVWIIGFIYISQISPVKN